MAMTPQDVDELYDMIKKMLQFWMQTKLVFLKAFGDDEITRDHENAYLQIKSEISRVYRVISDKLPTGLNFDGEKMMEMLKNAMTLDHLHQQGPGERQAVMRIWHLVYIKLTRTLGALEVMKAGYYPILHRDRLKSKVVIAKVIKS